MENEKKLKICHYIKEKYVRVHVAFQNNSEAEHYYICTKQDVVIQYIPSSHNLLENNKIFYNETKEGLEKIFKDLNPDVVLIANLGPQYLFEICKIRKIPIYFINHGILNSCSGPQFTKTIKNRKPWHQFNGYILTTNEFRYFAESGIPKHKIFTVKGTPQIQYLLSLDQNKNKELIFNHISSENGDLEEFPNKPLSTNKKTILLLQNSDGIGRFGADRKRYSIAHEEYCQILSDLIKFADKNDMHIITKIKGHGGKINLKNNLIDKLHSNKIVTPLIHDYKLLMYHLMFADIVVIQTCSTAFIESVIVNPNTIQCQYLDHVDFINVKKYDLLYADSPNNMNNLLNKYKDDNLINDDYLDKRKKYIYDYFGGELDQKSTSTIIDIFNKTYKKL